MDKMWKWYQNGCQMADIDAFITNLQKVNNHNILLKHQMLEDGDVMASVSMLFATAQKSFQLTSKAAIAALEMNKYLNRHYPNSSNERLGTEKLAISAMLEVLEPRIEKLQNNHLSSAVHLIINKTKQSLMQDVEPTRRNIYDNYVTTYKKTNVDNINPNNRQRRTDKIFTV